MRVKAAAFLAISGLLVLTGCAAPSAEPVPLPQAPPPFAAQDRTDYNKQQVALFLAHDPGWKAWLNAMSASEQANDALVDASRLNTSTTAIIYAITRAQDAYRVATSFDLAPFTVTSGCRNILSETTGSVQLGDGLTVRYGFIAMKTIRFENGTSCVASVGFIDEVDSSRDLLIAATDPNLPIEWDQSFSHYLVWRQPYWKLSRGTTLSIPELVDLIEK
jgi:hypothetical protein